MTTLTVTAKGQITLKQELLRHLNVGPGKKSENCQMAV
jgi:antitoxin PrlF